MPTPTSNSKLVTAVKNASPESVIDAGAKRIGAITKAWPFIDSSSGLIDLKARDFVKNLYGNALPKSKAEELANYLVLSTCVHALDGWRYLSESALALARGSRNIALHLAYYAELRAALSILAYSGIGIVDKKHFVITDKGVIEWFDGPTHQVVWEALSTWADHGLNAMDLGDCFYALGMNASEWAEACRGKLNLKQVVENWLKNWSIDLKELGPDRDERNLVSYNPDLRATALDSLSDFEFQFLEEACSAYSPLEQNQLGSLDLAIIHSLCISCRGLLGISLSDLWDGVLQWIKNNKNWDTTQATAILKEVKAAAKTPGGQLLAKANKKNKGPDAIFCRAFLLLRLASALNKKQWKLMSLRAVKGKSDWNKTILANYGVHSHLWDRSAPIIDYSLLDDDVTSAIQSLDEWMKSKASFSCHSVWQEKSQALIELCHLERVGIMAATL